VTKSYQALEHEIGFSVMYLLVYLFCYLPSLLHLRASDNLRCDRTVRCSETLAVKCQGTFPKCISPTCCKTKMHNHAGSLSKHQTSEWRCASILWVILHACFCKHVIMWICIYVTELWCSFPVSWFQSAVMVCSLWW